MTERNFPEGTQKNYHEINRYADEGFHVNVYRSDIHSMQPPGRWLHDFHWHEELQFTLVQSGTLTMHAGSMTFQAKAGDILYINSGIIHAVTEMSEDGRYASLNFPYRLLSFIPGSRMDQDYVLPYTAGGRYSAFLIRPSADWELRIRGLLTDIVGYFEEHRVSGNEYTISAKIVCMWDLLIRNYQVENYSVPLNLLRQQRLQKILSFVYEHYMEDITAADLAKAASISVGECSRTFQTFLQTTPHQYLKNYRIQASVEMLRSDRSISEIARLVGYNQVSNYISTFKSIIGCTPAKYRKQLAADRDAGGTDRDESGTDGDAGSGQQIIWLS
jgi:AraC-like DNA-binding protein/mannose-6-phosphate isomerase-like protein (cupin superfamily)